MADSQGEPIAIIGMGCRFAGGVDSLDRFWSLLANGEETVGDLPADRWQHYAEASPRNAAVLRNATRRGAFLDDVAGFDADFFGISPREATLMDPQQRITLEVVWEALEHAGVPPHSLAGTDAGVFVGINSDDYGRALLEDLPRIEAWTGIGSAYCAVANRVSYTLDLRGPSMAVDTACSASLVAVHLACQSLRAGESPIAVAGGVLVMAGPSMTVVLDAAGATSPDGRCKSFDASADGYGRGEGAGIVVLKRLSDARRDGDRVLAVVRGSAVSQDGRTNGIMAPSREAQEHLLRQAYRVAGVAPESVSYVEAHGTGTRVGDPIEAGAMTAVFGASRQPDQPLLIGSVKPNIGHLEAGAGIAGIIKTVLALRHSEIPPNRNFVKPNPDIPWDGSGLRVVTEPTPWTRNGTPRRAGVSGYGYGGTIAHVVLQEDEVLAREKDQRAGHVYPLSSASEQGVRAYAGRLADWLTEDTVPLGSVGHTLGSRRSHLSYRACVTAGSRDELVARLRQLEAGETAPGVTAGSVLPGADNGVVWVFSGHGSQWPGMGGELLTTSPAFAAAIDEIDPVFRTEMGFSARQAILDRRLGGVHEIQPMIFAVQVALAAVWRANGLRPAAIIGHSVGEIAAAVTAGVLSAPEGAQLVCRRSQLLRQVAGQGAMCMVNLSFAEAEQRLAGNRDVVAAIAAAPTSTVVSGAADAIARLVEQWRAEGLLVRLVDSDVAFHSPQMDPLLGDLTAAARELNPVPPEIPLYTTALTDPRAEAKHDGTYWADNLRNPVRFSAAITAAAEDGYRMFLEVSAHPVVTHSITETLTDLGIEDTCVIHTLRRDHPETQTFLDGFSTLHCYGATLDLAGMHDGDLADLPPIVWQHRDYWAIPGTHTDASGGGHDVDSHTLLGSPVVVRGNTPVTLWRTYLDESCRPYPGDHPVHGTEIVPAAVLLNTFFTAAGVRSLTEVALRTPISVTAPREIQVVLQDGALRLSARLQDDQDSWITHTTAVAASEASLDERIDLRDVLARCGEELPNAFVIARLASIGVEAMGFPWVVTDLRRGPDILSGRFDVEGDWAPVLDAALSMASVIFPGEPVLRMPAHIREITLTGSAPAGALVVATMTAEDTVDVDVADQDGRVLARITGLRYGRPDGDLGANSNPRDLVHELEWHPFVLPESGAGPDFVAVVGEDTELAEAVSGVLVADPDALHSVRHRLSRTAAVVVAPALARPEESVPEAAARSAWLLTRTVRWLAEAGLRTRVWCVTRGVRHGDSLAHAALWGLGRVAAREHEEIWGGTVDLGADSSPSALRRLLRTTPREDVISLCGRDAAVARLAKVDRPPVAGEVRCRPEASYLITGGLGVLGLEVAQWLAGRGARRIVLAGRRALAPRDTWDTVTDPGVLAQIATVVALEALGVTVRTLALDVSDRDQAVKLLNPAELGLPPIAGIVHAAGVLDNRMLLDVDEESLRHVMRPKVTGAWVLHELFPPGSLDFLVLFSSAGQLLGLTGQASYAAANAFLDALAVHRGAGTVSFGWTSWRGLGMSTSSAVIDLELGAAGTADVSAADALRCWEFAERQQGRYFAVLRVLPPEPGVSRLPLLSALTFEEHSQVADSGPQWTSLDPGELREYVSDQVCRQVAAEMRLSPDEVDTRKPLAEMGVDSVMTVAIRRKLEKRLRRGLPTTLFWNHPTISAVIDYLVERLGAEDDDET